MNKTMDSDLKYVKDQAPAGIAEEAIVAVFEECNKDVLQTLARLWDIPAPAAKQTTKIDSIRQICAEYECAMEKHIKNLQGQ